MDWTPLAISFAYLIVGFIVGRWGGKKLVEMLERLKQVRIFKPLLKDEVGYNRVAMFVGLLFEYTIYIVAIMLALDVLHISLAGELIKESVKFMPKLVAALIFIALGIMVASLTRSGAEIAISSTGIDALFSDLDERLYPSHLIGVFLQYVILLIAFVIALAQLGLQTELLSWITLSTTTLLTFFAFLAFYEAIKPYLPDIFAGMVMRNGNYVKIGEYLIFGKKRYRIVEIGLILSKLEGKEEVMRVRNSLLMENLKGPK